MNQAPDRTPLEPRASIRTDARLDTLTRAKVDDLATRFHRPRAAVLCQMMHWGVNHGQGGPIEQDEAQGPERHLSCYSLIRPP